MSSSFSSVKKLFLLKAFLSIKMSRVRNFFTNLETVSPDGHVVYDLYEFVFTKRMINEDFVLNCMSHEPWRLGTEHSSRKFL
jgi:hypothetical protein